MPRAVLTLAFVGALIAPMTAHAQRSIDPGMTQAQVVERLGEPAAVRATGNFTYLFYKNGCAKQCGMDDIVLLENDAVVDAVFRAPERSYTGKSSSPRAIPAEVAARTRPGARDVPVDGVVQAGKPVEPAPAEEAKPKEEKAAEPATSGDPKSNPTPATKPDPGTLRIPIKTQPRAPGVKRDSMRAVTPRR